MLKTGQNGLLQKLDELVVVDVALDKEAARLEQLIQLLDGLGLSVERTFETPPVPEGVIVADIMSLTPVEGSDHLLLTQVDTGSGQVQVVTGAPNTKVGLRTALAQPGTVLPAVGLEVSVRELAGVGSEGVLCSPRELGVYDYGGGLIALGDDAPVGAALSELWPAETVVELELTPNRADAFSILGVARDLAAKLELHLCPSGCRVEPGRPRKRRRPQRQDRRPGWLLPDGLKTRGRPFCQTEPGVASAAARRAGVAPAQ